MRLGLERERPAPSADRSSALPVAFAVVQHGYVFAINGPGPPGGVTLYVDIVRKKNERKTINGTKSIK